MRIPIKIKKDKSNQQQVPKDLRVDLRNNQSAEKPRQLSKKWLFLNIFLVLIIVCLGISYWLLVSQERPFNDLVPEEVIVFSLIEQEKLYQQVWPFSQFLRDNNFYGQEAINKIEGYLSQLNISFKDDFQSLFKKQAAFILKPANSETPFPFVLVFEKKNSSIKMNDILEELSYRLKNDFNYSEQDYRQIKIINLGSLNGSQNYTYAEIEKYFIISNSLEFLKRTIDSIVD